MKTKLIIVPGLIAISIILSIWFVYPAYSDPVSGTGFREKKAKLEVERAKMAAIDKKIKNAQGLSFSISSNPEKKKTLFDFIPESAGEEEIIDSLNYLISSEGMAVSGISVTLPKDDPIKEEEAVKTPSGTMKEALDASKTGSAPPVVPVAKPIIKDFEAKLTAIGDYQKVKILSEKINRLFRFNKPVLVEIKPFAEAGGEGGTSSQNVNPNILQLDLTLQYSLLKKSSLPANADDPIFSTEKFDMSPIDKIKEARNIEKIDLQIDQTGEASPFLP